MTSQTAGGRSFLTGAVRRARELFDRIPGAHGAVSELVRIEVIDRTLVIAGQALLAAVPLLFVISAFTSRAVESNVLSEVGSVMGMSGAAVEPVRQIFAPSEQVQAETGVVGVLLTFFTALSFARAVQRTLDRVWIPDPTDPGPATRGGRIRRCLVWMAGWVAYLQALALLSGIALPGELGPAWTLFVQGPLAIGIWWWTPRLLLGGRIPWRALLPGAVLTAFGLLALTRASKVVMPEYANSQVEQYGPMGIVFAAATWFVAFAGVVVVSAVLGRLLVTDPQLAPFARLLRVRTD